MTLSKYMQHISALICLSLCGLLTLTPSAYAATDHLNKIVAVVNAQVITQTELDQEITNLSQQMQATGEALPPAAKLRQFALDNLIAKDLQLQAAHMMGFKLAPDKLNQSLETIAQQHGIPVTQLPDALKHQGLSFDVFKKQIGAQLLIQQLQQRQLAGSFKIDPKQVDALAKKIARDPAHYQKNLNSGPSYHFYDVEIPLVVNADDGQLAAAKKVFDAIGIQLTAGKDLAAAVTAAGVTSSVQSTDLTWRTAAQLPEAFRQLIPKLKPGQVAPPLRAASGIHIIQLLAIKPAAAPQAISTITETHVRHILIKTDAFTPDITVERRLLNLRTDLMHGTDFASAAAANSQDPGSIAQGGDLGWVKPGSLDPKFEQAMNLLTIGEISPPIKTPFGWHLIQVLGRRQISDPQLAYQQLAQEILFNQKMDIAVKDFINELKAQAYIKVYT